MDLDALLADELGEMDEVQDEVPPDETEDTDADDQEEDGADDEPLPDADEGSEEEEAEEPDTEDDQEEDDESDADADDSDDDADRKAAPGLEKLAKEYPWAAKRIEKQSQQIQKLKAARTQEVTAISPTPMHPLADVETLEGFDDKLSRAKEVRRWCRENPDGGEVMVNGRRTEVSAEQVERKLDEVDALLEQAPDWKVRLLERQRTKPWESAEKVVPEVLEEGTPENRRLVDLVKQCPELKLRFSNWEFVAACAVRGMLQAEEEQTGKVRYARLEVGKKKPPPEPAPAKGKKGKAPARSPGTKRPPARNAQGGQTDMDGAVERFAGSRSDEDLKDVLAAELGGAW